MPHRIRTAGLALLIIATPFSAVACSSGQSSPSGSPSASTNAVWRVGLEAPLSGELATLGTGMLQGAQLAADQINAEGGVLDREIEIIPIDDGGNPDTGVSAANAAIAAGLDAVVGPYNSGVGIKTLPLYTNAGVVPVRLTSDNSTDGMGYTLQPMSDQISPVTSQALKTWLKAKKVAILYDSTQNYTTSVSKAVKDQLAKADVTVTSYQPIQPGKASYVDELKSAQAAKPDVIYSAVYYPEGAIIAGEMRAAAQKCLLDYASYDNGYVQNAGTKNAQVCQVVGVPSPTDFQNSAQYSQAFQAKFGTAPGTWSPYTFDSVKFAVDGAAKAGGWEPEKLNPVLSSVKGWQGWTGSVTIAPQTGNRTPATVVVTDVDDQGGFHVDKAWAKAVGAPYVS